MIQKLTYLENGFFQLDDSPTPLEEQQALELVASVKGVPVAEVCLSDLKEKKVTELEVLANKGVIVDMYEVEYPTPSNPMKETEQLAGHLDERRDFVNQLLFPGSDVTDLFVGLRSDIFNEKKKPALPPGAPARTSSWRQVLSFTKDS